MTMATKEFNGRVYVAGQWCNNKKVAQRHAKKWRASGLRIRVIKERGGYRLWEA